MASIKRRSWTTSKGEQREAWVVRYPDQDGNWRLKTFERQRDAKEWLPTAQQEVKQRTHRPDSTAPTVAAACEAWIKAGEADLERSTIVQRREHVDGHILPLLGAETKLSKVDVKAFRLDLLSSCSRALAKKVMASFKAILKEEKLSHLAADVKPIESGRRHKKPLEVGVDIPTPDEVRALWPHAQGYIRAFLAVAVFCGLRASELRGLRWQDLDFDDARQLDVRQRADKWQQIGPVKSETSYRSVPLSPFVVNALKAWRGDRIYPGEALVFGTSTGTVQSLPNIWRRHLAPLQVAAGVVDRDGRAKYGAHAFRHFHASWRLDRGDNIKRVSERMGHSSPVITLTLYSHLMPQADEHERLAADELALVG
jgi:integrase